MRNVRRFMIVLTWAALSVACGSGPPVPTETLGASQAAIRAAAEVGAANVPEASLHLRFAEEQLALGKKHVAAAENDKAMAAFRKASADAELALALARQSKAKQEAGAAAAELQTYGNVTK